MLKHKMHLFMCNIPLIVICVVSFTFCDEIVPEKIRRKRAFLVYPNPTKIQYIMGAGMPVELKDEAVAVGHVLKCSYLTPSNASDYTHPSIVTLRKRRSLLRWDIYEMLSKAADFYNLGGKACILRTICEIADIPFDKSSGLLGELLHALFTPTTTTEQIRDHTDNDYYAAHRVGREITGKCSYFFPECKINFADYFSKYV